MNMACVAASLSDVRYVVEGSTVTHTGVAVIN